MEEHKITTQDQLLTELLLRLSALEKVLIARGVIDKDEFVAEIKTSMQQLVGEMVKSGAIKDGNVILSELEKKQ